MNKKRQLATFIKKRFDDMDMINIEESYWGDMFLDILVEFEEVFEGIDVNVGFDETGGKV